MFKYPLEEYEGFYRCYTEHTNNISCLSVAPDNSYLLTASKYDKCVCVWQINRNPDMTEKDMDLMFSVDNR